MSGKSARQERAEMGWAGKYEHPGRKRRLKKQDMLPTRKSLVKGVAVTVGGALEIAGGHLRDIGFLNWIGYGTLAIGLIILTAQGGLYWNYNRRMKQ